MSLEIKGINSLMNKLNKLSNIEARKAVEDVADSVESHIRNKASVFSEKESRYIAKCEARDYKSSYFIDVGLKNDNDSFENWKGLWFHNWGYLNRIWGKYPSGKGVFTSPHILWFEEAVKDIKGPTLQKMKSNLRKEINKAME